MFAVKGTFFDTPSPDALRMREGYLVVDNGRIRCFCETLPLELRCIEVLDYTGKMIVPGMSDLHLHASQYRYTGTAMDVALIDWLSNYAYPEEARYADPDYAARLYGAFTQDLLHTSTTRSCIFATIHTDATLILQDLLEQSGMVAYVGKLNIDRNSPDYYREASPEAGMAETIRWILTSRSRGYQYALPMITPRFTPSVTDEYMRRLGEAAAEYGLPMQSHISENTDEIAWVKALCPDTSYYYETYSRYGLFGGTTPTVMAHCIYSSPEECRVMKEQNVFIAHCPTSNENVIAGIAPAAMYLREGYHVGLGSDIAGGHTLNLFAVMAAAVQMSKLRWKFLSSDYAPLSIIEAFYMATVGGGRFFGKVGLFEPGYEFDAAVLNEPVNHSVIDLRPEERLEIYAYRGDGKAEAKFVSGRKIL
ncbi:MAG: amidohydrolase family protein [Oscillospiraceae bacterium]|nr:amidohydrolase family protein [Oscillospiraceae bacterium]